MSNSANNAETATGGRRIRSLFAGILGFLAFTALLLSWPMSEARATTVSQCRNAWYNSSASLTCNWSHATIYRNQCRIRASCLTSMGLRNNADIIVHLIRVNDLSNCDGRLKDGSC